MEVLMSLLLGIGLSAACGFRVFLPPLVLSTAALYFGVPLPDQLTWLATDTAFLAFLTATLLEIGAYYVPWLDNALDTVSTPGAVIAGTLITGSLIADLDPLLQWSLALIAGGGTAGAVQAATNSVRLASTATTAGIGNPIVATIENALSVFFSIMAIVFPVITVVVLVIAFVAGFWLFFRFMPKRTKPKEAPDT